MNPDDMSKPDILMQELELVMNKVNHFDNLRNRTRQMALVLWVAVFGTGLTLNSVALLVLGIFVPGPLWYIEATYHAYQEGYATRFWAIQRFLTGRRSEENPFPIPDYYGNRGSISKKRHDKLTSILRNAFKRHMLVFYCPLLVVSFVFAILRSGMGQLGIIVGIVAGLIAVVGGVLIFRRWTARHRQSQPTNEETTTGEPVQY